MYFLLRGITKKVNSLNSVSKTLTGGHRKAKGELKIESVYGVNWQLGRMANVALH